MAKSGNKIETHGNLSPGIVHGDFKVNQTIVQQYHPTQTKRWRPLDEVDYPALVKYPTSCDIGIQDCSFSLRIS